MPAFRATHIPYGLTDPSKRTIENSGVKDKVDFLKYGIETGGESFDIGVLVRGGGGSSKAQSSIHPPFPPL